MFITEVETLQGPCEVSAMTPGQVEELHTTYRRKAQEAAAAYGHQDTDALPTRAVWNLARRELALDKAAEVTGDRRSDLESLTELQLREHVLRHEALERLPELTAQTREALDAKSNLELAELADAHELELEHVHSLIPQIAGASQFETLDGRPVVLLDAQELEAHKAAVDAYDATWRNQ